MAIIIKNTNERYKQIVFNYNGTAEELKEIKDSLGIDLTNTEVINISGQGSYYDSQDNVIITRLPFELVEDKLKKEKLNELSKQAFKERQKIIPDYRLNNMLLGITYDDYTLEQAKQLIEDYRNEYYRVKALVESATTYEELNKIKPNWPTI